jgi:hypothetical protein
MMVSVIFLAFADSPVHVDDYNLKASVTGAVMSMWNIVSVETKPYFIPFVSMGAILMLSGAASGLFGGRSKRRSRRHLEKTNRQADLPFQPEGHAVSWQGSSFSNCKNSLSARRSFIEFHFVL